ncbi:hypothetical protein ACWDHH_04405 [Janibacter hoylei]
MQELTIATWEKPEGAERLVDIEAEVIGACSPPLNLMHVPSAGMYSWRRDKP